MSRQLTLRVSDDFAERLERFSRRVERPMATVLETIGISALESAEADAQFEEEALAAWEAFQLTGERVTGAAIDGLFEDALAKANSVAAARKP